MKRLIVTVISLLLIACLLCGCGSTSAPAAAVATEPEISAADLVADIATTQAFTDEAVAEADIQAIVMAGVNAPSAMNGQPWHFSVVTDPDVMQEISGGAGGMGFGGMPGGFTPPEGADISADGAMSADFPAGGGMPEGFTPPAGASFGGGASKAAVGDTPLCIVISCVSGSEFDAGLACQNMSVEAQLLGYGTKILSSPTMTLNGANRDHFRELLGIPENQSVVAVLLVGHAEAADADAVSSATERSPLSEVATFK